MSKKDTSSCNEYKALTRRGFMGISAAAAAAAGLPHWFPQVAFSNETNPQGCPPCTLIKFFGRGGWDGMSMCIPYADSHYQSIRPVPDGVNNTIGFTAPGTGIYDCNDLDGYFGWHPIMEPLREAWNDLNFAFVQAVGYTMNHSYSHFVGQHQLEVGQPSPPSSLSTGWIGRHLDTRATPAGCTDPTLRAIGLNVGKAQSIVGSPDCIATTKPEDYNLEGEATTVNDRITALVDMYNNEGTFATEAGAVQVAINELLLVDFDNYVSSDPANPYPIHTLGNTFKAVAAMIDCGIAVEAFTIDYGSWDHHSDQDPHNMFTGGGVEGKFYQKAREMTEALFAFYKDMKAKTYNDYVVFGMTEFGRTAFENGSSGTDHAKGNCMFLMGPPVNGGMVYHPGWTQGNMSALFQNDPDDMDILTDIRLIAAEMIDKCMSNAANLSTIFPGYTPPAYLNIF